jgi:hypothetical protein
MKANELRIGNYVNRINRNNEVHLPDGITYVVQEIGFDCVIYPLGKNPATLSQMPIAYHNDLSPISLTEDWLIKFGAFKETTNILILSRFKLIWKDKYKYWYVIDRNEETYYTKLEFLHEFQNLYFALNGEELKLSNK